MKNIILALASAILIFFGWLMWRSNLQPVVETPRGDVLVNIEPNASSTPTAVESRPIKLYYYNAEKDKDSTGNIICSAAGLVSVERQLAVSQTPIQDTIKLLLRGELSDAERAAGLSTEFPLAGLELSGAALNDGNLTLGFLDPNNKTGGGSCRVAILWAQISKTASQFPEVKSVSFSPADLFQP